jgi:hypothetical protein
MPALFGPALKFPAALVVLGVFAATVWGILRLDFDCVVNASAFSPPQRLVILLVAGQVLVALCAFLAAAPGLLSSKLVAFPAMLVMAIWLFVFAGQTTRLSRAEPPSLGLRLGLVAIWMSILGALALLARAT